MRRPHLISLPFARTLQSVHAWLQAALCVLTPLSLDTPLGISTAHLSLPGEAVALLLAPVIALRLWHDRPFVLRCLQMPIAWALAGWLLVMGMGTVFSTLPVVSAKYLLAEGLHIWVYFVGALLLLGDDGRNLRKGIGLVALGMALTAGYTLFRHAGHGFSPEFTTIVPRPFFPDDTMYSAAICLVLPPILALAMRTKHWGWALLATFFGVALMMARCRGALLGVCAMTLFAGLLALRVGPRALLGLAAAGILGLILVWPFAQKTLRERADVSLLERLNRYSCAWRMAADRPLTGFGPGTYQFAYLPYQLPDERTRISVTRPGIAQEGRGGEAHSEYFQALADMGWPGLLSLLALIGVSFFFGAKKIAHGAQLGAPDFSFFSKKNILQTAIWLALIGYWAHGLVNNFWHTDKVAMLVLGGLAVLAKREIEASMPPRLEPLA